MLRVPSANKKILRDMSTFSTVPSAWRRNKQKTSTNSTNLEEVRTCSAGLAFRSTQDSLGGQRAFQGWGLNVGLRDLMSMWILLSRKNSSNGLASLPSSIQTDVLTLWIFQPRKRMEKKTRLSRNTAILTDGGANHPKSSFASPVASTKKAKIKLNMMEITSFIGRSTTRFFSFPSIQKKERRYFLTRTSTISTRFREAAPRTSSASFCSEKTIWTFSRGSIPKTGRIFAWTTQLRKGCFSPSTKISFWNLSKAAKYWSKSTLLRSWSPDITLLCAWKKTLTSFGKGYSSFSGRVLGNAETPSAGLASGKDPYCRGGPGAHLSTLWRSRRGLTSKWRI